MLSVSEVLYASDISKNVVSVLPSIHLSQSKMSLSLYVSLSFDVFLVENYNLRRSRGGYFFRWCMAVHLDTIGSRFRLVEIRRYHLHHSGL